MFKLRHFNWILTKVRVLFYSQINPTQKGNKVSTQTKVCRHTLVEIDHRNNDLQKKKVYFKISRSRSWRSSRPGRNDLLRVGKSPASSSTRESLNRFRASEGPAASDLSGERACQCCWGKWCEEYFHDWNVWVYQWASQLLVYSST